MDITASMVKELREKTGAGMMDCKKALTECEGDMVKAVDWLREKGIAKSEGRSGRIAAEGLTKVAVDGNRACLIEVNSETDFVAKNEQFLQLIDQAIAAILPSDAKTPEAALELYVGAETLANLFIVATTKIGEKITLRRFEIVEKQADEVFGSYIHMGGKISSLAVMAPGCDVAVAKDMAMQVASMNPSYISRSHMSAEFIEHERSIQTEVMKNDESLAGKPEKVLQGIVEGRLSKSLQEISLMDQDYFKDSGMKVNVVLKEANAEVKAFYRYAVGEGLEKREENFAEEVAKQIH